MNEKKRVKILLITICVGLIVGIVCSHEAWFPVERSFPRVPFVFGLPGNFAAVFDWVFSSITVIALVSVIFSRRPKSFLIVAICSLFSLCFFDCLRLQPWTYQYLLILGVFYFHDWATEDEKADEQTLGLVQVLIAGIYVWSGVQKMNFNFAHELLPNLLSPVQNLFPSISLPFDFLGVAIPLTESLTGLGLFFRKTRNFAVCAAILMHAFILSLLIAENYNSIVWVWNLTLILADVFAFWRTRVTLQKVLENGFTPIKITVCAAVTLPLLSFFGYWDMFLSGAYYSGNVEIPVVRINEKVYEKLPSTAKSVVFEIKSGGQKILPLFEWSITDTNAPVYLEERVFRRITREICRSANDQNQVELIIRKRPAILDGSYKVTQIGCAELE